jgi:hypothetical protein
MAEMKGLKHCILLLPVDVAIEYIESASIRLQWFSQLDGIHQQKDAK